MPASNFLGAPPPPPPENLEHIVVLLLEGGQQFLAKAVEAIQREDPMMRDHPLKRVLAIIAELTRRLNPDQGGELVDNLIRVYD